MTLHPVLCWLFIHFVLRFPDLPDVVRVVVSGHALLFPLLPALRWYGHDSYRCRTYLYSVGLALAGVLLSSVAIMMLAHGLSKGKW